MPFDAVFFDSGGTLFADGGAADASSAPSRAEVREARHVRLALSLKGLGHRVEFETLRALLGELEQT
ncbi:hypothetical protein LCGC14_2572690, partial [marine sediment metagenome]